MVRYSTNPVNLVMDPVYNLEGIRVIITRISNTFNFETPIRYGNRELFMPNV